MDVDIFPILHICSYKYFNIIYNYIIIYSLDLILYKYFNNSKIIFSGLSRMPNICVKYMC